MSRKNPTAVAHPRPVSQKAYDGFLRRIHTVLLKDHNCTDMINALDRYLGGDRETYASHLNEPLRIAFEMLRFEIDKAIERSARARRPRRRMPEAIIDNEIPAQTAETVNAQETPEENISEESLPVRGEIIFDPVPLDLRFPYANVMSPIGLNTQYLATQLPALPAPVSPSVRLTRRQRRQADRG